MVESETATTTIQVDQETREALLRHASSLQSKLGRRVTFDEVIRSLLQESRALHS